MKQGQISQEPESATDIFDSVVECLLISLLLFMPLAFVRRRSLE